MPILNGDQKIPRKEPPCVKDDTICKKVRPGHSDLSAENRELFLEYQYWRAIGEKPDCLVMRYWYEIIRSIEDDADESHRSEMLAMRIAGRIR